MRVRVRRLHPEAIDITAVGDANTAVVLCGRTGLAAVNRLTRPVREPTKGQRTARFRNQRADRGRRLTDDGGLRYSPGSEY